ncbi:MAG TPA: inorganic phosphate transporter [Chthoniobacteraceae bacterium]|jgi:PiT family inorganic phosphate transporter|nr:pitA [Chthoniobacter sp.]HEV7868490.1 inorganic phosphate transporter [Chthoniobacteraceae bacterium]
MLLFLIVLLAALAFEYINGFHDAANAIATVVSTKVLTPRQAIALAAFFNLLGAFMGTAVAKTIGAGQVDMNAVTMGTVLAALLSAIIWNLITWWFGIPSSSSHALIGGLCGAAVATSHDQLSVLIWEKGGKGLWPQIIIPMLASPVIGLVAGFLLMGLITMLVVKLRPRIVNLVFGRLQIASAAWMGMSHGTNDAQKTMGIITLALYTGTTQGAFNDLPAGFGFLHVPQFEIPGWVVCVCAVVMAAGTAAGGWRIIATMGHKMVRLQPVHGFAAETTAGVIISTASHFGIPLSTTHVISTSIMGVGAMKRFSAVKWGLVRRIVWAWVFTLPVTGLLGYAIERLLMAGGVGR